MKAACTEQPATIGEKRFLLIATDTWEECTCIMMLGMRISEEGRHYQEAIWKMKNGRSIHGSAHENWI